MGFVYITATAVLPAWFSSKRSLAVGIATSGAGLGGLAYNLATGAAVEKLGLKWSYRLLAFCSLAGNLVASLLLKDRNKNVKPVQAAFNWREYSRIEVDLVLLWGVLTELGFMVLLYSLPNYATSIGLSPSQGRHRERGAESGPRDRPASHWVLQRQVWPYQHCLHHHVAVRRALPRPLGAGDHVRPAHCVCPPRGHLLW